VRCPWQSRDRVGSINKESVESASETAGAIALMIFFVVGWAWIASRNDVTTCRNTRAALPLT
jgi:hypothetical protein